MSFMSFDFAMRAADAALQFQQGQSQNIRSTNQSAAEVGKGNAKRKDDLVRSKIEAEYQAASAEIRADKAEALMKLAEERKNNAGLAALLVGGGHLAGGILNGAFDMLGLTDDGSAPKAPASLQKNVDGDDVARNGYVSAGRIGQGENGGRESENGGVVTFDRKSGGFMTFGMNTTSGTVGNVFDNSSNGMAEKIYNKLTRGGTEMPAGADEQALLGMINVGPPIAFKQDHFIENEDGTFDLSADLRSALFGGTVTAPDGSTKDYGQGFFQSDAGETIMAGDIAQGYPLNPAYNTTANSVMSILRNSDVQEQLGVSNSVVSKSERAFEEGGFDFGLINDNSWANFLDPVDAFNGGKEAFNKLIFKPLSTSLDPFMKMASVYQEYNEEYLQAKEEYEAAKKQAAAALKKLTDIEAQLVTSGAGT